MYPLVVLHKFQTPIPQSIGLNDFFFQKLNVALRIQPLFEAFDRDRPVTSNRAPHENASLPIVLRSLHAILFSQLLAGVVPDKAQAELTSVNLAFV